MDHISPASPLRSSWLGDQGGSFQNQSICMCPGPGSYLTWLPTLREQSKTHLVLLSSKSLCVHTSEAHLRRPIDPTRFQLTSPATTSQEPSLIVPESQHSLSGHIPLPPSDLSPHTSLKACMYPLFIIGAYPELNPRDRQLWTGREGGRKNRLPLSFHNQSCISRQREKDADFSIC